tara:strand:+ start:477 stop:698 length:222 start_codon:yes stop_codon:yes gene_type:complete
MEILQKVSVKYETCYGSLKPGETFMIEGKDDLFLRMRSPEFSYVKLSDGEYNKVKWNNALVHRVNAHVVVTSL